MWTTTNKTVRWAARCCIVIAGATAIALMWALLTPAESAYEWAVVTYTMLMLATATILGVRLVPSNHEGDK